MRAYFLILVLFTFGCNSNQEPTNQNEQMTADNYCFVYPKVVDSLHIKDLYDSARWYIYTFHCDENYLSKSDTSKLITFGELPLDFDNLVIKHDTLEVNFYFMDKGQPILPSMTRDVKGLLTGVGFDMKTKEKIYMLSPNGYSYFAKGDDNRYENPLQSGVLNYIKNNRYKLNNCFKELATRKGIKK
jgi:hypothetical protein